MMRRSLTLLLTLVLLAQASRTSDAWGVRAHTWINRVAVRTIPADGPVFLKAHEDWIGYLSTIPDTWRRPSEPFLKMLEDPNHGWFKEQFAFMTEIPRSRYEFVLKLADEQRRLAAAGDPAATLTNVRWTGTMAYAAVEGYERMLTGMRRYRDLVAKGDDTTFVEREIAFYMGWTGHYTGDGAQPLHDTIHHDGWQGPNPSGYTTNPRVHGWFETQFVDAMNLEGRDIEPSVGATRVLADPFTAILAHLDEAGSHTEAVYRLEQSGALKDPTNAEARALVVRQAARGAALLRDLAHTAWVVSGQPPVNDPAGNPIVPAHPRYDPRTGSAPAHQPAAPATPRPSGEASWQPIAMSDPVVGKNFYLFEAIARTPEVRMRLEQHPALATLARTRTVALADAADRCGPVTACHARAFTWSDADITDAATALRALAAEPAFATFITRELRGTGLFQGHQAMADADLLAAAWRDAAAGINRVISVYALGTAPRYPKIDAASHDTASPAYGQLVNHVTAVMHDRPARYRAFHDAPLDFARRLLDINRRDEAGRHEPLHEGENAGALRRVPGVEWDRYPYAAIVVPGAGSDRLDVALDAQGRLRLELAVARFRDGQAPFIIVSGGYVHPNQTPFNEALEMKRALVTSFGVPPEAVVVDPHARHTTTNLRNASRLVLRYGFSTARPLLITTDASQSAYISAREFHDRCARELGYQPGVLGRRLSRFDQEFTPSVASLHADATDPLDP
jgi:hypothetical protein